jgi:nitrite reductase/ring-hydroxylating ferredoxin subunit
MSADPSSHNPSTLKPPLARVKEIDLVDGGAISLDVSFRAGRQSVIVTRKGTSVSAFINRCPHARWPLERFDGQFLFTPEGDLMCAAHGAVFDAITGACLGGPGTGAGLTRLATEANEGGFDIFV